MTKFPKFIYVTRENDDTKDAYFEVCEGNTAEDALTSTEKTRVATYELKVVREGKLEPVFTAEIG